MKTKLKKLIKIDSKAGVKFAIYCAELALSLTQYSSKKVRAATNSDNILWTASNDAIDASEALSNAYSVTTITADPVDNINAYASAAEFCARAAATNAAAGHAHNAVAFANFAIETALTAVDFYTNRTHIVDIYAANVSACFVKPDLKEQMQNELKRVFESIK